MKRKTILLLIFTTFVCTTLLFGCGQPEVATNTTEPTEETSSETTVEPIIEEETSSKEAAEPIIEETSSETTAETAAEKYSDQYTLVFDDTAEGYTDKYVLSEDNTMSDNSTHYVDAKGRVMDFTWTGPVELGTNAGIDNHALVLGSPNSNYLLRVWYGGDLTDESSFMKNTDKNTVLYWCGKDYQYDKASYTVKEIDNMYITIFKIHNSTHSGYCYFIDNYATNECNQFIYVEKNEIFNDSRALDVVNSILPCKTPLAETSAN